MSEISETEIKKLTKAQNYFRGYFDGKSDALDMVIKSLEQEPCEDCISRQAVINGIDNYIEKVQSTGAKDDFISFEELVVKALPSIYPKTDVLDKIRAEIDEQYDKVHPYNISCAEGLEMALGIIEKYKSESEVKG